MEDTDSCAECTEHYECDDGIFCNGEERCNLGTCQAGGNPCEGWLACNEDIASCVECLSRDDCDTGGCSDYGLCVTCMTDEDCGDGGHCIDPDPYFGGYCEGILPR